MTPKVKTTLPKAIRDKLANSKLSHKELSTLNLVQLEKLSTLLELRDIKESKQVQYLIRKAKIIHPKELAPTGYLYKRFVHKHKYGYSTSYLLLKVNSINDEKQTLVINKYYYTFNEQQHITYFLHQPIVIFAFDEFYHEAVKMNSVTEEEFYKILPEAFKIQHPLR